MLTQNNAKWIWGAKKTAECDLFLNFRKKFVITELQLQKPIFMDFSVDTNGTFFINGKRLPIGQFNDVPPNKTFGTIELTPFLIPGENIIAIRMYYMGKKSSIYCPGEPCLAVNIHSENLTLLESSAKWKVRKDPVYKSGMNTFVTTQMAMVFEYNARKEDDWIEIDYDDSSWDSSCQVDSIHYHLEERPVPFLEELSPCKVKLNQSGCLKRFSNEGTFAQQAYGDYLAPKLLRQCFVQESLPDEAWRSGVSLTAENKNPIVFNPLPQEANGCYAIFDVGKVRVGFLFFKIIAPAGCIVDIMHGEHLEDGRVRAKIDERNFCDRYHCKSGVNEFVHPLRRVGARYVELHFTQVNDADIGILYCGLIPTEFPVRREGDFYVDDRLFMKVFDVAEATLKLCMHEHYEDCPWREQALYAYDSRNQMLYGYLLFGNYEFAQASLDLLGKSYCGLGDIGLTSPSHDPTRSVIPIFTMVYIVQLYEHYLYSGDNSIFLKYQDVIEDILKKALERFDPKTGLYFPRSGENIWNFCEWSNGLHRQEDFIQPCYNLYFLEALRAVTKLYIICGKNEQAHELDAVAERLGKKVESLFYSQEYKAYKTSLEDKNLLHEHVQYLMLYHKLVPEDRKYELLNGIWEKKFIPATYSGLIYTVDSLMASCPESRAKTESLLQEMFEPGIFAGDTTLAETINRSDDFHGAGSLCHGWSSIQIYYAQKYLLGISPIEAGFSEFMFRPYPGKHRVVKGSIPTPHGLINVKYKRLDNGKIEADIRFPKQLKIRVKNYKEYHFSSVACNEKTILL